MLSTSYNVEINDADDVVFCSTRPQAEKAARDLSREQPNDNIFISKYRKQDGQQMYLNRDGWSCTGQAW